MKSKPIRIGLALVLMAIILLSAQELYSRAGGGGSGGGGVYIKGPLAIIVTIFYMASAALTWLLVAWKSAGSSKVIREASLEDKQWDMRFLKDHAETMFKRMQNAWMRRNLDTVKDQITQRLYHRYKQELDDMRTNKEVNMIENINILEVRIISARDLRDNNNDSYIAWIRASLVDYTTRGPDRTIINNGDKEAETITDLYTFTRSNNKWLLDHIDNHVDKLDLLGASNYKE